uniref:CSON011766 protein n=1 Tax=Culicoides sonorensis TaxID=179676 RepID=A0A336M803_CULSO
MPVFLKDAKWDQNYDEIKIEIQLKRITRTPIDIFTSSKYLKVHCSSTYIWEAFLLHEIRDEESRCKIFPTYIQFVLKKKVPFQWNSLEKNVDSDEKAKIRIEAVAEKHNTTVKNCTEISKYIDEKKREEIINSTSRDAKQRETYQQMVKSAIHYELKKTDEVETVKSNNFVYNLADTPNIEIKDSISLPVVRKAKTIGITFSDRNFITPKRESQEEEERKWLLKQKEARKAIGFVEEDLRPEERNPQWLKEKGDDFFKNQNYLGAISAYSTAIMLCDKYWELFLNRSAAHFACKNFKKCIEDCTHALELLSPPCEANLDARKSCLIRRGAALARLGLIRQSYDEILAALKLKPDKILERDAEMLRCKLENELN